MSQALARIPTWNDYSPSRLNVQEALAALHKPAVLVLQLKEDLAQLDRTSKRIRSARTVGLPRFVNRREGHRQAADVSKAKRHFTRGKLLDGKAVDCAQDLFKIFGARWRILKPQFANNFIREVLNLPCQAADQLNAAHYIKFHNIERLRVALPGHENGHDDGRNRTNCLNPGCGCSPVNIVTECAFGESLKPEHGADALTIPGASA